MLIPKFWAQAKAPVTVPPGVGAPGKLLKRAKKSRMVQRFGWSQSSQDAAEQHAQERLTAAIAEAQLRGVRARGETDGPGVAALERIAPYGLEGIPIREEIIAEHPHATLTRNRYGAICLNTPDVLFADVDLPEFAQSASGAITILLMMALAMYFGQYLLLIPLLLALLLLAFWQRARARQHLKHRRQSLLEAIRGVADRNSELLLRVYETPNGFRVLALHALFDPAADATTELLTALRCDPHYRRMCLIQQCFRARDSAKPWRTSMSDPRAPHRIAVWPLPPEKVAARQIWVQGYQRAAQDFAACRYLETLGRGTAHPVALEICTLHDTESKANSTLPLA